MPYLIKNSAGVWCVQRKVPERLQAAVARILSSKKPTQAYATGAFLADLLRSRNADKPNGWVYRSLKKASFNGEAVAWRTFEQLFKGLQGLGFLDHVPGHKVADDPYDDRTQYAARFRATPALLKFCVDHHVEPTDWSEHFLFKYDLPEHPVDLRARKPKDYLGRSIVPTGRPMEFERTSKVAKIEDAVRELNEFFDKQILRGGEHHGYIRIFSNGDDGDFDWNKGGRLFEVTSNDQNGECPLLRAERKWPRGDRGSVSDPKLPLTRIA